MLAVLAEDKSDYETLKILIRRLLDEPQLAVRGKGYGGCGELFSKGARDITTWNKLGSKKFVICVDADGDEQGRRNRIKSDVVDKTTVAAGCCVLVPVEEIEAWILADVAAVGKVITGWKNASSLNIQSPESIRRPKERLEELSRGDNFKPRYSHASHNPAVARHLDLQRIEKKCPSFKRLKEFLARK